MEINNKLKLYQKIFDLKNAVNSVKKDGTGMFGKAIKLSTILNKINKEAEKQKLLITESVKNVIIDVEEQAVAGVLNILVTDIETGEYLKTSHAYTGKEINKDMGFALGKASTYSRKYAYLQAFGIPTNDKDPDFNNEKVTPKSNWGTDSFGKPEIDKVKSTKKDDIFGKPKVEEIAQTKEEIAQTLDEVVKNNPTKGDI